MTITESDVVALRNDLIPSLVRMDLQELRLLAFCAAHLDSRAQVGFSQIKASVKDLMDIFPLDYKAAYAVVRRAAISINRHPAEWEEPDGTRRLRFWFAGFDYLAGEFTFLFSPGLEEKLLALKGDFTQHRLRDVYQFRSSTAWHLYLALRQWKSAGRVRWHLDEFRAKVGIVGKYPRFTDLVKRVVAPGLEEINATSDIKVQWQKVLRGRKIVDALEFFIIDNPDTKSRAAQIRGKLKATFDVDQLDAAPEIRKRLVAEFTFSADEARHIGNRCSRVQAKAHELLDKLKAKHLAGEIDGPLVGYVIGATDKWLADLDV